MARTPLKRICAASECGNTFVVSHGSANNRYCPIHAELAKHGRSHKNPHTESLRQSIYKDKRWRICRKKVFARDGYLCVLCGATELESPLVCDHIGGINYQDPFNPDLCRTLCLVCSGKEDGKRSGHNTRQDRGVST